MDVRNVLQSRDDLKAYIKRALGDPLIIIDVTDDQMDDKIDNAIQYFQEYWWDGAEEVYFQHLLTQQEIDTGVVAMPDDIISVQYVLSNLDGGMNTSNIFDIRYQLRMNGINRDLFNSSVTYYHQAMTHMDLIAWILNSGNSFRFNYVSENLHLDFDKSGFKPGDSLIIFGYSALDPEQKTRFFNVKQFKEYAVALVKSQWASNIKKYSGISLPGGVQLDGNALYQEAQQEINNLETWVVSNSAPLDWFVG